MPDVYGFNHLPREGAIVLRCIWCGKLAHPGNERGLARHARTHRREAADAAAQSVRERQLAEAVLIGEAS